MNLFSIKNTVMLALMQVGVIVSGVLGAGVTHKWLDSGNLGTPFLTVFLMDYGVLILASSSPTMPAGG